MKEKTTKIVGEFGGVSRRGWGGSAGRDGVNGSFGQAQKSH